MTTLAAGSSVSLTLANNGFLEVSTNGGFGSVTITPTRGSAVTESWGPAPYRKRWSGYPEGATVTLTNTSSAEFDYETDSSNLPGSVQALVSKYGNPQNASLAGPSPWARLFGPNEFRQSPWAPSSELTTPSVAWKYVTAQQPANGPAMFRREGASIMIDGSVLLTNTGAPNYCNINTFSAGIAAGALQNKTLAILVYAHRLGGNLSVKLRIGLNSSNYLTFTWAQTSGNLIEGWNVLLVHTGEATGASSTGQTSFQTGGSLNTGFTAAAGTFDFSQAIGYVALELTGMVARTNVWFEGIYQGGRDIPTITLGFDIQTAGLDNAKLIMDRYGLKGYAAVPTANGSQANPQALWSSADAARLIALAQSGWDILQHSVSHNTFATLYDDGLLLAEHDACRQQLLQLGLTGAADFIATPNLGWSNRSVYAALKCGIKWSRCNGPLYQSSGLIGPPNVLVQGSFTLANMTDAVRETALLDSLIAYGASAHLYSHAIQAGASDGVNTNIAAFEAFCAQVAARVAGGTLRVLTPTQYIAALGALPSPAAALAPPSRLAMPLAASPAAVVNQAYYPLRYRVTGGTVSEIAYSQDGTTFDALGVTAGSFVVSPGDQLRITYTVAPTVTQYSL